MRKTTLFVCGLCLLALALCVALVLPTLRVSHNLNSQQPPVGQAAAPEPDVEPDQEPEPESVADDAAADPIAAYLQTLSIEEKVGQLFLARRNDTTSQEDVAQWHLGGLVLFSADFEGKTADEICAMIAADQSAAEIPLLIAVDEEGGTVCRVSENSNLRTERFSSPRQLYASGGVEALIADAAEKSQLLLRLGINVNLAPVCDLSDDPSHFMYERSLGADAQRVSECISAMVQQMTAQGLGCVLKHFPGYGGAADTHTGLAWDSRTREEFEQADFLPFRAGMEAGAGAVMVSHIIVQSMDPELPASLSQEVHRILREELDFEGVIVTDDLSMDAIGDICGDEQAAVLAILAGNDLLCCTDYQTRIPAVLDAVQTGEISYARIDEACYRVLQWKAQLGLISFDVKE